MYSNKFGAYANLKYSFPLSFELSWNLSELRTSLATNVQLSLVMEFSVGSMHCVVLGS